MKKKFSIILIIISILILVVACSSQEKPEKAKETGKVETTEKQEKLEGPEKTISEFTEAMQKFNIESMDSKFNPEGTEFKGEISKLDKDVEDSLEKYFLEYSKDNSKKITYTINESKVDGDKAVVNVTFKHVNGVPVFEAALEELDEKVTKESEDKEMTEERVYEMLIDDMKEKSKSLEEVFVEKALDIDFVKVKDEWYIDIPNEEKFDEIINILMSNLLSIEDEADDVEDSSDE